MGDFEDVPSIAGFVHERKNALAVLLGFAQLARLQLERGDTEAALKHLATLEEEIRRASHKLQRYLGGTSAFARTSCDLAAIAAHSIALVWPRAQERGIEIELRATPLFVNGDPAALEQVFLNLLLNGIAFARTGLLIQLSASPLGIEARISDDGPGVTPQIAAQLFTPLVTSREGGSGLGLFLSRQIARAHGGELSLDHATPGTMFLLRLPALTK